MGGLLQGDVRLGQARRGRGCGPVGVDPAVDFDVARVGLLDQEAQGIPAWIAALGAGQVAAPWLELRGIERVGFWADLKHDRVEVDRFAGLHDVEQLGLRGADVETDVARPIDVEHGCDPHGPKLALVAHVDQLGRGLVGQVELASGVAVTLVAVTLVAVAVAVAGGLAERRGGAVGVVVRGALRAGECQADQYERGATRHIHEVAVPGILHQGARAERPGHRRERTRGV